MTSDREQCGKYHEESMMEINKIRRENERMVEDFKVMVLDS